MSEHVEQPEVISVELISVSTASSSSAEQENIQSPCGSVNCPEGSTLTPEGRCQEIITTQPTLSPTQYTVCEGDDLFVYSEFGTRFYDDADSYPLPLKTDTSFTSQAVLIDNNGIGTPVPFTLVQDGGAVLPNEPVWENPGNNDDGRLNIAGIWTCEVANCETDPEEPINLAPAPWLEWIGFSRCIEVPTTKKYCVGLGADNKQRFSVNGQLIAEWSVGNTRNFKYWNVIEITLEAGTNYIEVEGWNERCTNASFAAEIYDATSAELQAITTLADLENVILFTTRDMIGESFDIGEDSGVVCPDGFAYDACNTGDCVQVLFTEPETTECCYIVENCNNPNETYAIQLTDEAPDVTIDHVYQFGGNPVFDNSCFTITSQEECEVPDFASIAVITDYGINNCLACNPSEKFESCNNPGTFVYVSVSNFAGTLTVGNVYELTAYNNDCYTYVGEDPATPIEQPTELVDLATDYCLVCTPCHLFEACSDNTQIRIRFAEGTTVPALDAVLGLSGDPALLDECWQYKGTDTCDQGDEDYIDVEISNDYNCDNCDICKTLYKLTECCGEETLIVEWAKDAEPLDTTQTYIFDFAPDTCFTVEFIPTICGEDQISPRSGDKAETP